MDVSEQMSHKKIRPSADFFLRSLIFYITLIDTSQLNALEIRHRGEYRVKTQEFCLSLFLFLDPYSATSWAGRGRNELCVVGLAAHNKTARAVFDYNSSDYFIDFRSQLSLITLWFPLCLWRKL